MRIGLTELFVIVIVILALVSPDKLIDYAGKAGKLLRKVSDEKDNIKSATEPLQDIIEPVVDVKKDVDDIVEDVKSTIRLE